MAIQLKYDSRNLLKVSDILNHKYENENLIKMTDTLFGIPDETQSSVLLMDEQYIPNRIHLTTMLHAGQHNYELIVEHIGKSESLFICFALKKINKGFRAHDLTFPLLESPLKSIMNHVSDCLYYKTSTNNHVFFCTQIITVGEDFPTVLDNPKKKYKEIFEPNLFERNQNIMTQSDKRTRTVETLLFTEGFKGRKKKPRFLRRKNSKKRNTAASENETNLYGSAKWKGVDIKSHTGKVFKNKQTTTDTTVAYMECDMIGDDGDGNNISMSEYALTPLSTNTYERGMASFVHFLHAILIFAFGGVILPIIQTDMRPSSIIERDPWVYFFTAYISVTAVVSVFLIIYGCSVTVVKGRRRGISIALWGIYLFGLWFVNIIGLAVRLPNVPKHNFKSRVMQVVHPMSTYPIQ